VTRLLLCLALALLMTLSLACDGGPAPVPPDPSTFIAHGGDGVVHIAAGSGAADPGTTATITDGGSGSDFVEFGGGVLLVGTWDGTGPLTLSYVKEGVTLEVEVTPSAYTALVTKPFFATGSAPNDLVAMPVTGVGRLFVANSLDNTVTTHSVVDGTLLSTVSFPQFSSPSYLAEFANGRALITRNGDNILSTLDLASLQLDAALEQPIPAAAALPGPGAADNNSRFAFVPLANILSFAPTVYGPGQVAVLDMQGQLEPRVVETSGRNTVSTVVYHGQRQADRLFVLSAGELQFDENFVPSVVTSSFIDEYEIAEDGALSLQGTLNLGLIGASTLEVDRLNDGSRVAYLGSLVAGNVYKVHLDDMTVLRGFDNPIVLTSEFTYVSDLKISGAPPLDKQLLATSFNTDQLFVIDVTTDSVSPQPFFGPFDLSLDPELLAGPLAIELGSFSGPGHRDVFVLCSLANCVSRVRLLQLP
jgi:hypothetical protein